MKVLPWMLMGLAFTTLTGFLPAKHSKLEVIQETKGADITLTFKVTPDADMTATIDNAPWSLALEKVQGLTFTKQPEKWTVKDPEMDVKLPGFKIVGKATGATAGFDYNLRAFVCTKDKTRCYPEQHKGQWSGKTK